MVKIDDDTQKALLLFNRRSEAADAAKTAERNLEKATKAKDEAAAALKQVQGGGAEAVSAAEAEWRSAVDTWQRLRDGEELPEDAPAEEDAETDDNPAGEDTPVDDAPAEEDTPADDAPAEEDTPADDAPAEEDAETDDAPAEEDAETDDNPAGEDTPADEEK